MKAFENYIKKEYPHIDSGDEMFAWDIWRAAVEWSLEKSKYAMTFCHLEHELRDELKELGDK